MTQGNGHKHSEMWDEMKVLFLHKYGQKAASFRYRFQQYFQYLEKEGIDFEVSSLLDDQYLSFRYTSKRPSFAQIVSSFVERTRQILRASQFDLVVLYCECIPYFPAILEKSLQLRSIPYIVDFDDAIFHAYDGNSSRLIRLLFRKKIQSVVEGASVVFAGNQYLADYARKFNSQVIKMPTVVDLNRYREVRKVSGNEKVFKIGWIGSPSTAMYLESVAGALRKFCSTHSAKLILVGSGQIRLEGVPTEIRDWSEETEIQDILDFNVGIMPLWDSPWSRGKCGFKLIQYMVCGLPVLASPIGANCYIVEQGKNGFLARTEEEWVEDLTKLHTNPDLRVRMGKNGRARIQSDFSLQKTAPQFIRSIKETPHANIHRPTVKGFGFEWSRMDQSQLESKELENLFEIYFQLFPWDKLPQDAQGFDLGCGSGRWARCVLPKVGKLHCVEPDVTALSVARQNLDEFMNCEFHAASVDNLPFEDNSMDFGYALGVLHHVPDTSRGVEACVKKLKPGAPMLLYLYYNFENRPGWFRLLWRTTDLVRRTVSHFPGPIRYAFSQVTAALVYYPMARMAQLLEKMGMDVTNFPLSFYRSRSFYTMRTDTLDRFGTRLEHRFARDEVRGMMERAGLTRIEFSKAMPRWCAVGFKA